MGASFKDLSNQLMPSVPTMFGDPMAQYQQGQDQAIQQIGAKYANGYPTPTREMGLGMVPSVPQMFGNPAAELQQKQTSQQDSTLLNLLNDISKGKK